METQNFKNHLKFWKIILLSIFFVADIFIWYGVHTESSTQFLTVAFLNVGQGDAVYIESPNRNQMLIDGGPPHVVLSELRKVMPFYDRSIDTLLVTNPDVDHFAGFIDILNLYTVSKIIEPGTISISATYKEFERIISEKHLPKIIARRGMIIHMGGDVDLKILFPDHDVSKEKTNDGSIVAQLVYGSTTIMLTGDAPNKIEEYVLNLDEGKLKSTLLKIGHHGSRTSASKLFISAVNPEYAVISAGKKNRYGHPHSETLELLKELGIRVFGTYEEGMILVKSDGKHYTISTER